MEAVVKFRARKTLRFGPVFFTFTQNGFSSWGIRIGPFTRNFTRSTSSLNTPGIGGLHWGGRRRGQD